MLCIQTASNSCMEAKLKDKDNRPVRCIGIDCISTMPMQSLTLLNSSKHQCSAVFAITYLGLEQIKSVSAIFESYSTIDIDLSILDSSCWL